MTLTLSDLEISALVRFLKVPGKVEASGVSLYVARGGRGDKLQLAKPCAGCLHAAEQFGVGRVVFSVDEERYAIVERE